LLGGADIGLVAPGGLLAVVVLDGTVSQDEVLL
jgi:hypothetical protein